MDLKQHVILIGPMGAGKSTIGRILSETLSVTFTDIDKVIQDKAGASIPWIFDIEGEGGFREREKQALEQIVLEEPQIIATGGGCVLSQSNCDVMRNAGDVFYLVASIDQQIERTSRDKNRPLLQTANPRKTLSDMAIVRNPIYDSLANINIDTNSKIPKLVAQDIIQYLEN